MPLQAPSSPFAERSDKTRLPVFPPGVPYLLRELSDADLPYPRMAEVLERFPAIVARLVALANSAWSSPSTPITDLENSCARLGFGVVRSVAITLAVASPFNPHRCPAFDAERFWSSALLTAETAARLGARIDRAVEQSARTTGLLHNLGLLWLAEYQPEQTDRALSAADPDLGTDRSLETQCGSGYAAAGATLGELLGLPAAINDAIAHQLADGADSADPQLTRVVGLARHISACARQQLAFECREAALPGLGCEQQQQAFEHTRRSLPRLQELARSLFC